MFRLKFLNAPPERRLVRLSLLLGLAAMLVISLGACGTATGSDPDICPPFPVAGSEVADEIEARMFPSHDYPAFWHWIDRLDVLHEQLKDC
jgi:hypothetical protein